MSAGGASFSERSLAVLSIRRLHACQSGLRSLLCRARQQVASSCDLPAGEWRQWLDERRREFVTVAVINSGCGIPPDQIDRIFEPFLPPRRSDAALVSACRKSTGSCSNPAAR